GVLNEFKGVLEDATSRKVFHNYSFDFHELCNHGIETRGLAADTMHMARLWNTGRITSGGYGLEALSAELVDVKKVSMKELFAQPKLKKVCVCVCVCARARARMRACTHSRLAVYLPSFRFWYALARAGWHEGQGEGAA
ncbi:hypothetical protein EON67_09985, partial [archaeon]